METGRLTRGQRTMAVAGVLLAADLLALPWYHKTYGAGGLTFLTEDHTGVEPPVGWLGVIALLLTIGVLGLVLVTRLGGDLPEVSVPWHRLQFGAGVATFVLLFLKLAVGVGNVGYGAVLGVLVAAGFAYGGYDIDRGLGS